MPLVLYILFYYVNFARFLINCEKKLVFKFVRGEVCSKYFSQ